MKNGWLLFAGVLLCLSPGCRGNLYLQNENHALSAENRIFEDQIYDLRHKYKAAKQELRACQQDREMDRQRAVLEREPKSERRLPTTPRQENLRPKTTDSQLDSNLLDSDPSSPKSEPSNRGNSRASKSNGFPRRTNERPLDDGIDLSPPQIDAGLPADDPAGNSNAGDVHGPEETSVLKDAAPNSLLPDARPKVREATDQLGPVETNIGAKTQTTPQDSWVTQIVINAARSGGADFDDRAGDDGVVIVVEPRNAVGEFVPQPSTFTIVALDPEKSGETARIARWEFDNEQTLVALSRDHKGFVLKGAWTSGRPSGSMLKVFVRYQTIDGRILETQRDITVSLIEEKSQRWTPRSNDHSQDSSDLPVPPRAANKAAPGMDAGKRSVPSEPEIEPEQLEVPPPKKSTNRSKEDTTQAGIRRILPASVVEAPPAIHAPGSARLNSWKPYR